MIKIKHFLDAAEPDDGQRMWVEPIGLTQDLRELCKVSEISSCLGPPRELWQWFAEHPDGYDLFRAKYHEALKQGPHGQTLLQIACAAQQRPITLLHQGDDPAHNTATALYEFLTELEAYCPGEF
jgi:uncharacterized protein YeaO (DUF488 family)